MGGVWLDDDGELFDAALDPDSLAPDRGHGRGQAVAAVAAAQHATDGDTARAAPRDECGGIRLGCRRPLLWRHRFPEDIVQALVSFDNPRGSINNSELELAGHVAHSDVLARERDLLERTIATGTDNTASHGWSTKGASSSAGPSAYLLRLQAMHQRVFRYQQRTFYLPGDANGMADDCSRLWHLSDDELVSYFDAHYPQPRPWRLCHLNPGTASAIHSALRCERQPLPEVANALAPMPPTAPWELQVPQSAHGRRKQLYEQLGRRPKTWSAVTQHAARS